MPHPLVSQLHFARSEFLRCLDGLNDEDARRRLGPMNCLSWIIGHMALQEHYYWVVFGQGGQELVDLENLVGYGRPASTPPLDEMWAIWRQVTAQADLYLNKLTAEVAQTHFVLQGESDREAIGTRLQRNIFHYWFHLGEAHAIRQQLGHSDLPDFVGNMSGVRF